MERKKFIKAALGAYLFGYVMGSGITGFINYRANSKMNENNERIGRYLQERIIEERKEKLSYEIMVGDLCSEILRRDNPEEWERRGGENYDARNNISEPLKTLGELTGDVFQDYCVPSSKKHTKLNQKEGR